MPSSRPLVLVTPWFGRSSGGAEVFCTGLAQQLIAAGHRLEIWTTCCPDPFHDWGTNVLPEGTETLRGIPVRRFAVRPRNTEIFLAHYRAADAGLRLSEADAREYLANTINSDTMNEAIAARRDDTLFAFLPYLYGTTFFGAEAARPSHTIHIPCLHREPIASLPVFAGMLARAARVLFLSRAEMRYALELADITPQSAVLLGGGLDTNISGNADRFREAHSIREPFLLYVGRKVPGKGADLALSCYAEWQRTRSADPLQLVMLGEGQLDIPAELRHNVHSFHAPDVATVYDAMAACEILIQPSFFESFSLVMMEAWLQQRPVLVNARCDVTREHCRDSQGGLWFSDAAEFCEAVAFLRANPEIARDLGARGAHYVRQNYALNTVIARFESAIAAM